MNTILLGFLSIIIFNSVSASFPTGSVHYLNWITHQTKWPVVLRKSSENTGNEYAWFKFDDKSYVSMLPNFKGNYFVSKEAHGSDLTIFGYDTKTHEQLTSYEPIQKTDYDEFMFFNDQPEYHHLVYLKSQRIKIDRDEQNSHANVTCIADVLVDGSSMQLNSRLVDEMKKLAVFKINLREETKGDLNQFVHSLKTRNHMTHAQQHLKNGHYKKLDTSKLHDSETSQLHQSRAIRRIKRSNRGNKNILNVRLSFGPIYVPQPFDSRLISCNLDLVNHQTMQAVYDHKVFGFLSQQDLGTDMTAQDYKETERSGKARTSQNQKSTFDRMAPTSTSSPVVVTSTPTEIKRTRQPVKDMTDDQLNKIFETETVIEDLEQKIIKEQGIEKYERFTEKIQKDAADKQAKLEKEQLLKESEKEQVKKQDRRLFEMDEDFLSSLDKIEKIELPDIFNAANKLPVVSVSYLISFLCSFALFILY